MAQWSKLHLHERPLAATQWIGEKKGSKRHVPVDGRGVPLSIVVTGANRHNVSQLEAVLDEIIIERPQNEEQYLCADKGYTGNQAIKAIKERNYIPHIKKRGEEIEEKKKNPDFKARRWVVEAAHSWFNRFRKLLVRYEKLMKSTKLYCILLPP
jgi:transposase